jgi:hypothetical protein
VKDSEEIKEELSRRGFTVLKAYLTEDKPWTISIDLNCVFESPITKRNQSFTWSSLKNASPTEWADYIVEAMKAGYIEQYYEAAPETPFLHFKGSVYEYLTGKPEKKGV